jgi:hypothetical protein
MSEDPYRSPDLPAGAVAERRLRERAQERLAAAQVERARSRRRRLRIERAMRVVSVLVALYLVAALAVRLTVYVGAAPAWLNGSLLVAGIATPMTFFISIGLKVPPRPGTLSVPRTWLGRPGSPPVG